MDAILWIVRIVKPRYNSSIYVHLKWVFGDDYTLLFAFYAHYHVVLCAGH